jgi:hypothetical protein
MSPFKDSDDEEDDDFEDEQESRRRMKFVPTWARYVSNLPSPFEITTLKTVAGDAWCQTSLLVRYGLCLLLITFVRFT